MSGAETFDWKKRAITQLVVRMMQRFDLSASELQFSIVHEWDDAIEWLEQTSRGIGVTHAESLEDAVKSGNGAQAGPITFERERSLALLAEGALPLMADDDPVKKYAVVFKVEKGTKAEVFLDYLHQALGDELYHGKLSDGTMDLAKISADDLNEIYKALKEGVGKIPQKVQK